MVTHRINISLPDGPMMVQNGHGTSLGGLSCLECLTEQPLVKPWADVTAAIEMCVDGNSVMLEDGDNG